MMGHPVVFLADDLRRKRLGGRSQRIDRREERLLGQRALKHHGGVKVGEGVGGGRVGQVVRRHINRLDRGDRTLVCRGDPLLKGGHFLG